MIPGGHRPVEERPHLLTGEVVDGEGSGTVFRDRKGYGCRGIEGIGAGGQGDGLGYGLAVDSGCYGIGDKP